MKIKSDHYATLREAFASIRDRIVQHRAAVLAEGRAKDVDMRVRWDALHALGRTSALPENFVCGTLYTYMDDTHIDTALRAVMRELSI